MIKDFLEIVKTRKTTYEFSERKVKDSDIKKVLEAARWCPSSHNTQNWSFIVVKDKKIIERLLNICFYGFFHTKYAVIIAVILEPIYLEEKAMQGLLLGGWKEFTYYHQYMNISIPVITMAYAAESMGINSCIISPIIDRANNILGVPKAKKAVLLLGLGYEKKGVFKKPRKRKDYKDIVFKEKYGK